MKKISNNHKITQSQMQGNSVITSFAKTYKIHTIENDKFVWDASGNPKELNTLILCKYHGGENQRFYLSPSTNGKWRIMCLSSGFSLQSDKNQSGSILHFNTVRNVPEQEWQLIEIRANTYIIKAYNGLVVDVCGGTYKNQAKLIVYEQHNTKNQQWVLQKV